MTYAPPALRDLKLRYVRTTDRYLSVTSSATRVKVSVVVSSSLSRTTMLLGGSATVAGKVSPNHAGKRVYLQRKTSTGWVSVTSKLLNSTSNVSFTVKPTKRGTYTYRLSFAGDADHLGGFSPSRAVKVV